MIETFISCSSICFASIMNYHSLEYWRYPATLLVQFRILKLGIRWHVRTINVYAGRWIATFIAIVKIFFLMIEAGRGYKNNFRCHTYVSFHLRCLSFSFQVFKTSLSYALRFSEKRTHQKKKRIRIQIGKKIFKTNLDREKY